MAQLVNQPSGAMMRKVKWAGFGAAIGSAVSINIANNIAGLSTWLTWMGDFEVQTGLGALGAWGAGSLVGYFAKNREIPLPETRE